MRTVLFLIREMYCDVFIKTNTKTILTLIAQTTFQRISFTLVAQSLLILIKTYFNSKIIYSLVRLSGIAFESTICNMFFC